MLLTLLRCLLVLQVQICDVQMLHHISFGIHLLTVQCIVQQEDIDRIIDKTDELENQDYDSDSDDDFEDDDEE